MKATKPKTISFILMIIGLISIWSGCTVAYFTNGSNSHLWIVGALGVFGIVVFYIGLIKYYLKKN